MKKFFVDYLDKGGDYCHVWVEANSKDDAIYQDRKSTRLNSSHIH